MLYLSLQLGWLGREGKEMWKKTDTWYVNCYKTGFSKDVLRSVMTTVPQDITEKKIFFFSTFFSHIKQMPRYGFFF